MTTTPEQEHYNSNFLCFPLDVLSEHLLGIVTYLAGGSNIKAIHSVLQQISLGFSPPQLGVVSDERGPSPHGDTRCHLANGTVEHRRGAAWATHPDDSRTLRWIQQRSRRDL